MQKYLFYSFFLFVFFLISCTHPQPKLAKLPAGATLLAFGDSLTYGTGANTDQSYPSILAKLTGFEVINAGEPGETTSEGLERLPTVLDQVHPHLVLLCLGGNDLLRRMPTTEISDNLDKMIKLIQNTGAEVILIAAPSPTLTLQVPDFYTTLAEKNKIPVALTLMRNLLRQQEYKSDAIHLNAEGYAKMAAGIFELLQSTGAIAAKN